MCVYVIWFNYTVPLTVTEMLGNVLSLKDEDDLSVDEDEQVRNTWRVVQRTHHCLIVLYMYILVVSGQETDGNPMIYFWALPNAKISVWNTSTVYTLSVKTITFQLHVLV